MISAFNHPPYKSCTNYKPHRLYAFLDAAYTHANRTLLQLLIRDQALIPRLRSLKRFFFLAQSTFLTHLLDLAHTELRKSAKSASTTEKSHADSATPGCSWDSREQYVHSLRCNHQQHRQVKRVALFSKSMIWMRG